MKRILKKLSLEFQDKEIEKGYRAIKEENSYKDYKICLAFYGFHGVLSIVYAAINHFWLEIYASVGMLALLLALCFVHRCCKKYTHLVTLAMVIFHNISQVLLLKYGFHITTKTRLLFAGYGLCLAQGTLIFRLYQLSHKILAIILTLILRFVFLTCYVDPGSFNPIVFIRHFTFDMFIIYSLWVSEKVFREVYRKFVQKEEELLKFKELIAESLPQSLVVVSFRANDLLFSNNAFRDTFDRTNDREFPDPKLADTTLKESLESFVVERSTIRETGGNDTSWTFLDDSDNVASLTEILQKLSSEDYLGDKAILLAASITQKNQRKLFEITLKKMKWDSNDAFAILFNDITYQESLISLKLANINKDRVIATVSHELRTPLNGIIGILDLAEKKVEDTEVTEYISMCKDNAHLLLNLVNSILDLQQISTGRLRLNPIEIDIRRMVSNIVQLFSFQCLQKNISIEFDIQKEVPIHIYTDENRLKQILINIIGNAVKFTSKGGIQINIKPSLHNLNSLLFSVVDTGNGIKEEDQKHLFKMYSRIEEEEGVNKNGAGLGLTASNALVMLLNGGSHHKGIQFETKHEFGSRFYFEIEKNLKCVNQSPKKGLRTSEKKRTRVAVSKEVESKTDTEIIFHGGNSNGKPKIKEDEDDTVNMKEVDFDELLASELQLKIKKYTSTSNKNRSSEIKSDSDDSLHSERILTEKEYQQNYILDSINIENQRSYDIEVLIVDDNPFNLLVAKHLVQEFGCKVKTAMSGQEAIEIVQKNFAEGIAFKVIFMDCQMPIMDGFETTKVLKDMMKNGEIPEIPIYAWTANNSEEDVKKCYQAGMTGHLPKPASKFDILKIISEL